MPRQLDGSYVRRLRYTDDAHGPVRSDLAPQRFDEEADDIAQALSNTATRDELAQVQTAVNGAVPWSSVSAFMRTLFDDGNAATARQTIGLGTAATKAEGDFLKTDGSVEATSPVTAPEWIASTALKVKEGASTWSFAASGGIARLALNGTDFLRIANTGTHTIFDGTAHRDLYHSGNLNPVRTINGQAPDSAGNVTVATSNGGVNAADYGGITVSAGGAWSVNIGHITNARMAVMPVRTIKGNVGTQPTAPSDITLDAIAEAMAENNDAMSVLGIRFIRPRLPYRRVTGTTTPVTQIVAIPTENEGAAAVLNLYASVDGGAYFLAHSGPNNAELAWTINGTHSYVVYSVVTFNGITGPSSERLSVSIGGDTDAGGFSGSNGAP